MPLVLRKDIVLNAFMVELQDYHGVPIGPCEYCLPFVARLTFAIIAGVMLTVGI